MRDPHLSVADRDPREDTEPLHREIERLNARVAGLEEGIRDVRIEMSRNRFTTADRKLAKLEAKDDE